MAVLAEAISVVIKRAVIDAKYPGGWVGFAASVPNSTLCADDHLARVGFMQPSDVEAFIEGLSQYGMVYLAGGVPRDVAVVDQQRGPMVGCDWLDFFEVQLSDVPNGRIAACRLLGDARVSVATPASWSFQGSLSQTFGFAPSDQAHKGLRFLRHEDGVDVYLSALTGKEVFVGRTSGR